MPLNSEHGNLEYLVIGYVCQDVVPSDVESPYMPGYIFGGTATYAARTAKAMGLRVGVVTSTSPEFALSAALPGIETVRVPAAETTTFENRYVDGHRIQTLHAIAGRLTAKDIPHAWRQAEIVHLAVLAQEMDLDIANIFPGAFIGITPQGWMRQWDKNGLVTPCPWRDAHAALSRADAVVLSEEDVNNDWQLLRDWANYAPILVVTQGSRGATMFIQGEPHHVPAPTMREVDPTGAGDIFAAVFFAQMRRTGDPHAAACMATCLAAHSVMRRGLDGVPNADEVHRCLDSGGDPCSTFRD